MLATLRALKTAGDVARAWLIHRSAATAVNRTACGFLGTVPELRHAGQTVRVEHTRSRVSASARPAVFLGNVLLELRSAAEMQGALGATHLTGSWSKDAAGSAEMKGK